MCLIWASDGISPNYPGNESNFEKSRNKKTNAGIDDRIDDVLGDYNPDSYSQAAVAL